MKFVFFFCLCESLIYAETIETKHWIQSGFVFAVTLFVFIFVKVFRLIFKNFQTSSKKINPHIGEIFEESSDYDNQNRKTEASLNPEFEKLIQNELNKEKFDKKDFQAENDSEFKENERNKF